MGKDVHNRHAMRSNKTSKTDRRYDTRHIRIAVCLSYVLLLFGCQQKSESNDSLSSDRLIGKWTRVYSSYPIRHEGPGALQLTSKGTYRDSYGLGLAYRTGVWFLQEDRCLTFAADRSRQKATSNRLFCYRVEFLNRNKLMISRAQAVSLPQDPLTPSLIEGGQFYNWGDSQTVFFERAPK